jgi:hypothetical protein
MKPGPRLATGGKTVTQAGITDSPFTETKEEIGG